ncbi:glycosyltransferase family 2 protein [Curtobacterium flaccumfaciens]|nr:glycosyltransferase family 2 protein [Curtobacterium flaccumfaciens]
MTSVAVVICAYTQQRWGDLQDSVESARRQPEAPEVVVVIDHEPELLLRAAARWPGLRVVPNTEDRGLSGARNTGVALTDADVVAFLDDDATADPDWLGHMLTALEDPEVVGVGGPRHPVLADRHRRRPVRRRAALDRRLLVLRPAGDPRRRPQRDRLEHGLPAATRSCSRAGSARASVGSATSRSGARRPSSASESPRPVRVRGSATNRGRTCRTGSHRTVSPCGTCVVAATTRASRRPS